MHWHTLEILSFLHVFLPETILWGSQQYLKKANGTDLNIFACTFPNKFALKPRTYLFTPSNPFEWKSFSRVEKKNSFKIPREVRETIFKANTTWRAPGTINRRRGGGRGKSPFVPGIADKNRKRKSILTSDSIKPGQTAVLYHYCGLSRFFWIRRYSSPPPPNFWSYLRPWTWELTASRDAYGERYQRFNLFWNGGGDTFIPLNLKLKYCLW